MIENADRATAVNWQVIMSRRQSNLLLMLPVLRGIAEGFDAGVYYWDASGFADYAMDRDEIARRSRAIVDEFAHDPASHDRYVGEALEAGECAVRTARQIGRAGDLDAARLNDLATALQRIGRTMIQPRYAGFSDLQATAQAVGMSPSELRVLTAPRWASLSLRERFERNKGYDAPDREAWAATHAAEWGWVFSDTGFGASMQPEDVLNETPGKLRAATVDPDSYEAEARASVAQLVDRYKLSRRDVAIAEVLAREAFMRQYRRETYSRVEFFSRPVFVRRADGLSMELEDLYFLRDSEVLDSHEAARDALASRRSFGFAFVGTEGVYEEVDGPRVPKLFAQLDLEERPPAGTTGVTGLSAFPGEVVGQCHVVLDPQQKGTFPPEGIFVATQATPNLVRSLIGNIAAIVTDEGDLTSHASLVAWEHKLPCVVDTRFGTKVLRSGRLAHLRAAEGRGSVTHLSGPWLVRLTKSLSPTRALGGKARGLVALIRLGIDVPAAAVLGVSGESGSWNDGLGSVDGLGEPVVLRSSHFDEDMPGASLAGAFPTRFVPTASTKAITSFFQEMYDRAQELSLDSSGVRVVVQQFVNATASGVVFSRHPAFKGSLVIEAGSGIAAVVAGRGGSSRWIIERRTGQVQAFTPATQGFSRRWRDGALVEEACGDDRPLREETVEELRATVMWIEEQTSAPVCLEFAIEGGRVWWLQMRELPSETEEGAP